MSALFNFFHKKTRLSAGFLTEYNANALCSDLSNNTIPQNTDNVKYVDLTGIEPANPEFLDPSVHQHQAHTALVYHVLSLFFFFILTLFTMPHTLNPVSAQTSTESAQVNYQPLDPTTVTPQSPLYANLMVNNLLHAFSCLMAGTSPMGQPCVDYLNGVPVISSVNTSGGLLGAVANLNTIVIANPPIRTGQYLATLGDSLGITKEAHAQVGGSGAGVLEPILKLWQVSRNIAYIAMIIIFLIIGLMVMFRQRINPQTVITAHAALPGLVIGLIMITFSYFLASLLTDTAYLGVNIVGYYFSVAQTGNPGPSLTQESANHSVSSIFSNFVGVFGVGDIASAISSVMNTMNENAQLIIRIATGLAAFQFGNSLGGPIGAVTGAGGCALFGVPLAPVTGGTSALTIPLCGFIGSIIGSFTGGAALATKAATDPPGMIAWVLYIVGIAVLIYVLFKLLFRLINTYLSIIFLTITAPFHFLAASLPGRQEIAVDWIRNMLCNILAFPAVMAVLYFAAYLIGQEAGPNENHPFLITGVLNITGTQTLPLFGGMDVSFIRMLLAFGALLATPAIPDIICRAVGKIEQYGQMIGQEISGANTAGRGYATGAQGQLGQAMQTSHERYTAFRGRPTTYSQAGEIQDRLMKSGPPEGLLGKVWERIGPRGVK